MYSETHRKQHVARVIILSPPTLVPPLPEQEHCPPHFLVSPSRNKQAETVITKLTQYSLLTITQPQSLCTWRSFSETNYLRDGSLKNMSECQTKAGNQECFWKFETLKTWKMKIENFKTWKFAMLFFEFMFRVHGAGSQLKMSECQTKAGDQECFWKLEKFKTWKPENFENTKNDPWDMLNNFCFHV